MLSNKMLLAQSDAVNALWLTNFIEIYQQLSRDNISSLSTVYHQDIVFQDPLHKINGFNNLSYYFSQLYENVSTSHFVINRVLCEGDQAAIYWTMTYQHKRLKSGLPIEVEGHSFIKGEDNKVIYHRDYLDLGQMLYEQVPILGNIIRWLKKRVSV